MVLYPCETHEQSCGVAPLYNSGCEAVWMSDNHFEKIQ